MEHPGQVPDEARAAEVATENPRRMNRVYLTLWATLTVVVVGSFAALLYFGGEVYQMAPPVPEVVASSDGEVIFTGDDLRLGQDVWRSIGGHELGSVWGHGAYTAPDWTADWVHREAVWLLERWAQDDYRSSFESLPSEQEAALTVRLQGEVRTNTYDEATGVITVSPLRVEAIRAVRSHYTALFGDDLELDDLRESYAMPRSVIPDPDRREAFTTFLFWASWACVTERPGEEITYTHNWPPDDLVGNRPTGTMIVTSVVSFVLLLGGIGGLAWFYAATRDTWRSEPTSVPADPLIGIEATPSMRATHKYFWVVGALAVAQIGAGIVTAHYGVEGTEFYGIALAEIVPYSLSRTWHVQLGMLWIATSWLATGLCLVPLITGREPRFQLLGGQCAAGGPRAGSCRLNGGPGLRHTPGPGRQDQLLGRAPGVRIPGLGPALAGDAPGGPASVAGADAAALDSRVPGRQGRHQEEAVNGHIHPVHWSHSLLLLSWTHPGTAHQPGHRRVLALVGGPPVGGGLLRGLRHGCDLLGIRPSGAGPGSVGGHGHPVHHHPLPDRRRARDVPSPLLHRHHARDSRDRTAPSAPWS